MGGEEVWIFHGTLEAQLRPRDGCRSLAVGAEGFLPRVPGSARCPRAGQGWLSGDTWHSLAAGERRFGLGAHPGATGWMCKCGVLSGVLGKGAGKAAPGTCRCSKGCGVPGDAREPPHFHRGVGGVVAGAVPWSVWGCGGRWVPGRAGWVLGAG